jgi:hypothetical protein
MKFILSFIIFLCITTTLHADGIFLGYATGHAYLKMGEESRQWWLIGATDGIIAESIHAKSIDVTKGHWLGRCIEGLSIEQIRAMFEKELKEKPEAWHAPAALIFYGKMQDFCKGRTK